MKLVVGLGNPGSEYVGTRHNIGFDVIDALARKLWSDDFNRVAKTKFDALAIDGSGFGGEKMLLLKPLTYMNLSGRSVQAAMGFYQLVPADVMIVLDDVALPCGKIRIRSGGSSGGHNGLKDIERMLGTQEYPRLRIGIDPPPPRVPQKDYVLGKFSPEQRKLIDSSTAKAVEAIQCWMEKGVGTAMSLFNAEEKKNDE